MDTPAQQLNYLPADYTDSRRRFKTWLEKFKSLGTSGEWLIPSRRETDLVVDHIYLPPTEKPERLFVMTSGVHGLEAYAGSGIQSLFFNEFLTRLDRRHIGLWIIHSMNPYGFRHHTRGTENHVNLNRNCSIHQSLFATKNPSSLELSRRFIPRQAVQSAQSQMSSQLNERGSKVFVADISLDDLIKSVGIGQYEAVDGLEFGGFGLEEQTRRLIEGLKELMPKYRDILLFDLHTGLGDRGRLHLLTGDEEGCVEDTLFAELFSPQEDKPVYDFTPADAEGFYKTHGALNNVFPEIATSRQRVAALTLEFGTLGHARAELLDGLNRWFIEHQGTHYGYANPNVEQEVKALYLEKFFPRSNEWRNTILDTSREFFKRVFQRAGALT